MNLVVQVIRGMARNKAICSEEPNNKKQVSEDPRKKARACIVTCPLVQ